MKIGQQSLIKVCQAIGSKKTTPGGGAAAAVTGALSASLVVKVANFTLGKKQFRAVRERVFQIAKKNDQRLKSFLNLAEDDCHCFNIFTKDKKNRQAIENLTKIPLEVARQALLVYVEANYLAEKGNLNLLADSRTAMELATAAFYGALEMVRANLPLLQKGSVFEEKASEEIGNLLNQARKIIKPN